MIMIGTVKRICRDGDYGFIVTDDSGIDVFYHRNDFVRAGMNPPQAMDRVEFQAASSPKGHRVASIIGPAPHQQ